MSTGRSISPRRSAPDLGPAGEPAAGRAAVLDEVARRYAVAITPVIADRIAEAPGGPVARQFLPDVAELLTADYEVADPIGDGVHSPVPGLVHRYPDRVLFKVVAHCAVYCRFCFRREMVGPGHGQPLSDCDIDRALDYIRAHPAIWEVIFSGGDPLTMPAARIARLSRRLGEIPHVRTVRWHTRVPVVAPQRISVDLVSALRASGTAAWVAVHVNHADELTETARAAIGRMVDGGVPVVSQTVLLAGVNDEPATLERLLRALVEIRVKPYYLHHLDAAPGTHHFRTSIARGQEIAASLRGRVSGLAQPLYVLDLPGGAGKVPAGAQHLCARSGEPGVFDVTDAFGRPCVYRDPADRS